MLRLYSSGGAQDIDLLGSAMPPQVWAHTRNSTCDLLEARGRHEAAEVLRSVPFELHNGTNGFGDEFDLLYAELPLKKYLQVADMKEKAGKEVFRQIVWALEENDVAVRFIAVSLVKGQKTPMVAAPEPEVFSETLERALAAVERALADDEPATGIDRVHTAFHAYLRAVAEGSNIDTADSGVTELFKRLRNQHPSLEVAGPRGADVTRMLNAMATIVDALNPLRNKASLAHAADELLPDAEAMVVINAVRTLFHYIESKLREG